jgi:transcription elongation factor Elf1
MKVKPFKSATYFDDVELTDYHCPNCGQKTVYQALGEGDYYEGPALYCKSCRFDFTMPRGGVNDNLQFQE